MVCEPNSLNLTPHETLIVTKKQFIYNEQFEFILSSYIRNFSWNESIVSVYPKRGDYRFPAHLSTIRL